MEEISESVAYRASTLAELGMNIAESKILSFLVSAEKPVRSIEIERCFDMRQPQVSLSIAALQSKGWVREAESIGRTGKGRPEKTYELCVKFSDIVKEIGKEITTKQQLEKEKLQKLISSVTGKKK
jgi:predicted transcriptional regulator